MALTVRPDDEVYQFDTVWLGPDEYTLPIQARYVAWGTWLACFMVAAVVLIPLGGGGPAGVLGSVVWSLGVSVVLSRAVMLVVDHERPLRSLPALFNAEARAALQSRRRGERSLLIRTRKVHVRDTPPKVLAMRERQRSKAAAKAAARVAEPAVEVAEPAVDVAEPAPVAEPAWTADPAVEGWRAQHPPAWSIRADEHDVYEPVPVPVEDAVREFVRAPDPETTPAPTPAPQVTTPAAAPAAAPAAGAIRVAPVAPVAPVAAAAPAAPAVAESEPVVPAHRAAEDAERPPAPEPPAEHRRAAHAERDEQPDPHAALEARILLPARKDR
jgi:hypothetical protein